MKHPISPKLIYALAVISWVAYVAFTFAAPLSSTSKELAISDTALFWIRISIALPYLLIWLAAAYGFAHIASYAARIQEGADGRAFGKIALGLGLLVVGLIMSTLVSSWRSLGIDDPNHLLSTTIVLNYLYSLLPLISFLFLYQGTKELVGLARKKAQSVSWASRLLPFFVGIVGGGAILVLFFTNSTRQMSLAPDVPATYYLSDPLAFLTIVAPIIISWVLGIFAVVYSTYYQKNVSGVIYKHMLRRFTQGIGAIVVSSIILQALLAMGTERLIGIGLIPLLILVYIFLFVQAAGYGLVARGAQQLTRLEE